MKFKTILLSIALVAGAVTSCTDTWDDHYTVATHGEGTLWQQIGNDASLSNFKAVLEATGYDKMLNSSQVFTVFAPTNDQLTVDDVKNYIAQYNAEKAKGIKDEKNTVIKEFINNHISLYNYSVSNEMPDAAINMMNGKRIAFTHDSFAGRQFLSKNNLSSNGILFKIGEKADYVPSVYEQLSKDADLDSVWTYLSEYSLEEFMPGLSVPGEIIDGKTHYLDSVTVTTNEILEEWLDGQIDNEDSTYWMVVPTNKVWRDKILYIKGLKKFLDMIFELNNPEYLRLRKRDKKTNTLFVKNDGITPINDRLLRYRLYSITKKCHIPNLNYHCLRHTFAINTTMGMLKVLLM